MDVALDMSTIIVADANSVVHVLSLEWEVTHGMAYSADVPSYVQHLKRQEEELLVMNVKTKRVNAK